MTTDHEPQVDVWHLPEVSEEIVVKKKAKVEQEEVLKLPTAGEIESIRKQAEQTGFEEGYANGMQEAKEHMEEEYANELKERLAKWDSILDLMHKPFKEIDQSIIDEMLHLVTTLTHHLVHRELTTQPDEIIAIMREALKALPSSSRKVFVHLNAKDKQLVETALVGQMQGHETQIIEDPTLNRGDCIIETETSRVDSRLDKRLDDIFSQFLGKERKSSHELTEQENPQQDVQQ